VFTIPETGTQLPAVAIGMRPTRDGNAWLGPYHTVRLVAPLDALRVHVGAGEGAATADGVHLVSGAGLRGRWYAIGDFVQPYAEYIASRALPRTPTRYGKISFFTQAALATFQAGTILNVGRAAGLFGHPGGGEQAEFLEGPAPRLQELPGTWANRYGHA